MRAGDAPQRDAGAAAGAAAAAGPGAGARAPRPRRHRRAGAARAPRAAPPAQFPQAARRVARLAPAATLRLLRLRGCSGPFESLSVTLTV